MNSIIQSDHATHASSLPPPMRAHILKLEKADHDSAPWQAAIEPILLFADLGFRIVFARIGMMERII